MTHLVRQREEKIRALINHPWKIQSLLNDTVNWNKLCVSMDVINDTQTAIDDFFSLPSFDAEKGGYLFLYGLLQAFVLQQDAINHLSEALFNKSIDWKNEYPDIFLVREFRNNSAGHPTKRGRNESFHFISRHSVSKGQFRLISYYSKDNKKEYNTLYCSELRVKQENSVIVILDKIINLMEREYNDKKSQFESKKLSTMISDLSDSFLKLYDEIRGGDSFEINPKPEIDSIKDEITKRYGSLSEKQGVNDLFRKMDRISEKIVDWRQNNQLSHNLDAEIFVDSLKDRLEELEGMLKEIDEC